MLAVCLFTSVDIEVAGSEADGTLSAAYDHVIAVESGIRFINIYVPANVISFMKFR
jgi:hypothetical protein